VLYIGVRLVAAVSAGGEVLDGSTFSDALASGTALFSSYAKCFPGSPYRQGLSEVADPNTPFPSIHPNAPLWQFYVVCQRYSHVSISKFGVVQWRTQEFCSEGVQQIQLRTEDRENGDLGAVEP